MLFAQKTWLRRVLLIAWIGATGACTPKPSVPVPAPSRLSQFTQRLYTPLGPALFSDRYPITVYQEIDFYYGSGFQTTYQYDALGRLTVVKRTDLDQPNGIERVNLTTQYTYQDRQVVWQSTLPGSGTLTLNPSGYDLANRDVNTTYVYDQDGYLLRKQTPYVTTLRTIANGNLVREVIREPTTTLTTAYEYDLGREALIDPLQPFRESKASRNLITQSTCLYESATGSYTVKATYCYEFDEQNRVSKQMAYFVNTNQGYRPSLSVTHYRYVD